METKPIIIWKRYVPDLIEGGPMVEFCVISEYTMGHGWVNVHKEGLLAYDHDMKQCAFIDKNWHRCYFLDKSEETITEHYLTQHTIDGKPVSPEDREPLILASLPNEPVRCPWWCESERQRATRVCSSPGARAKRARCC